MCNCCNNPIYRAWENFCRNCGADKKREQFIKRSEWEFYGEAVVRARGYVIIINSKNEDNYYEFTQKKVKELEKETGLTGQELADLIAEKTTKISYNFNWKYGTGSISYDLRTEEEKEKARLEREERIKKDEEERQARIKKDEEDWNKYAGTEFTAENINWRIVVDRLDEYSVYSTVFNMFRVGLHEVQNWTKAKLILPSSQDEVKSWNMLKVDFIKTIVTYE